MEGLFRKQYSATVFSFLVLIASLIVVWRFAAGMEARQSRVVEVRDRIASFELNRKVLTEETKDLEDIKAHVQLLEQNIVTDEAIPDLLSNLEALAQQQNIKFSITSVQNPHTADAKKLSISFTGSGAFANIEAFLQALLSERYQVKFTRFDLHKQDVAAADAGGAAPAAAVPASNLWSIDAGIEVLSY